MPTKTEQSDLLMALYGRHGESPLPVIAPSTPGGCFDAAFEAVSIAIRYRTPVILLSDSFLASSSEPWRIPSVADLPAIDPGFADRAQRWRGVRARTAVTSASRGRGRSPGRPGLQHRIGGLEKADGTGNISYDGVNHELMTELRAAKVAGIADELPPLFVDADPGANLLVLGWGSTEGAIRAGARRARAGRPQGRDRAPAPSQPAAANTGDVLRSFDRVSSPRSTPASSRAAAREVPGRRRVLLQGPGPAALRRRDRATDRGAPMTAVTHIDDGDGERTA